MRFKKFWNKYFNNPNAPFPFNNKGFWGAVLGGAAAGLVGGFLSKKGGGGGYGGLNLPPYEEDPLYQETQDILYGTGADILEGKPPEYFAPIGEIGGETFEDLLRLTTRDVTKGVEESLAKRGIGRGGIGTAAIAKRTGDISTQMRWADLMRALEGRKWMFGAGTDILSGVRSGALSRESLKSRQGLGAAQLGLQSERLAMQGEMAEADMWSSILSSGLGIASNIYGINVLSNILKPTTSIDSLLDWKAGSPYQIPPIRGSASGSLWQ